MILTEAIISKLPVLFRPFAEIMSDASRRPLPRYAIITGAGSGLGRGMALELVKYGSWHVAVVDIDASRAAETLTQLEASGLTGQVEVLDVRNESEWQQLRDRLQESWPQLDLLINNAGVLALGATGKLSVADWDWLMSINLRGVMLGCRTFCDWLVQNPARSYIVNIASAAGFFSPPGLGAYSASKAAVISLSETLHSELRRQNVGVTVICPYIVRTNLTSTARSDDPGDHTLATQMLEATSIGVERAASEILRATFRNRLYKVVGRRAYFLWWLKSMFPNLFLRLQCWEVGRRRRGVQTPDPSQ